MANNLLEKFKNLLGLNEELMDDEEEMQHEEQAPAVQQAPVQNNAIMNTAPQEDVNIFDDILVEEPKKRRIARPAAQNNNIIDFSTPPSNEMVIVEPKGYDDAMKVVSLLKSKKSVIVNVVGTSLTAEDTNHILDFICGAVCAIDGNQKTVTKEGGVYLFTPGNININTLEAEQPRMVDKSGNNLFLTINDITFNSQKTKVS